MAISAKETRSRATKGSVIFDKQGTTPDIPSPSEYVARPTSFQQSFLLPSKWSHTFQISLCTLIFSFLVLEDIIWSAWQNLRLQSNSLLVDIAHFRQSRTPPIAARTHSLLPPPISAPPFPPWPPLPFISGLRYYHVPRYATLVPSLRPSS